jgi:hypothetical protein
MLSSPKMLAAALLLLAANATPKEACFSVFSVVARRGQSYKTIYFKIPVLLLKVTL